MTATGLPHRQEQAWTRAWLEAKEQYTIDDLIKLGRAVKAGVTWTADRPLNPQALADRLLEFLAESHKWDGSSSGKRGQQPQKKRGIRFPPTWEKS